MTTDQNYTIQEGCYLRPTPAGAYYAIQSNQKDPVRSYLRYLLSQKKTVKLDDTQLVSKIDPNLDAAMTILYRMQSLGYLQVTEQSIENSDGALEALLPPLLEKIVDSGKAILADEQGFYISVTGFAHESAEELSALGANLHSAHERYQDLLTNNLGIKSTAWGVVNPAGHCEIGFWPLYFSRDRFTLILSGVPQFNTEEFTQMIACLSMRYND